MCIHVFSSHRGDHSISLSDCPNTFTNLFQLFSCSPFSNLTDHRLQNSPSRLPPLKWVVFQYFLRGRRHMFVCPLSFSVTSPLFLAKFHFYKVPEGVSTSLNRVAAITVLTQASHILGCCAALRFSGLTDDRVSKNKFILCFVQVALNEKKIVRSKLVYILYP